MLETKDYWTIGMSGAALVVSFGALTISTMQFVLARRRDQRELEAKRPLVDLQIPACDALGPWEMMVRIINRDDVPIDVIRFVSDINRKVFLTYCSDFPVPLIEITNRRELNYIDMQIRMAARETKDLICELRPVGGKRIPSDTEVEFSLEYRKAGPDTDVQRVSVCAILNP